MLGTSFIFDDLISDFVYTGTDEEEYSPPWVHGKSHHQETDKNQ